MKNLKELLEREIEDIPMLVEDLIPKTGLVCLAGSSDCGKSTFLRQLGISISSGSEFLNRKVDATNKKVIYVSTEDDENSVAFLMKKQVKNPEEINEYLFMFNTERIWEELKTSMDEKPADLIIIDTFTDLYSGDINMTNRVRSYLNKYTELSKKYQCAIMFLHHIGKANDGKAPSKNALLGSQGIEAKMRMVMILNKDKTELDKRYLTIVKANYLPEEKKNIATVLKFEDFTFSNTGIIRAAQKAETHVDKKEVVEYTKTLLRTETYESALPIVKKAFNIDIGKSTLNNWVKDATTIKNAIYECSTNK